MNGTAWFSLRRRLLGLLLGGVSVCWLATLAFIYLDAHHEVDELLDAQLAQTGQALLALASGRDSRRLESIGPAVHPYQRQLRFQIWRADGRLLLRSDNTPETPLSLQQGFSESQGDDGHWRYYSQWDETHSLQVQVGENHAVRDELIGQVAWRLLFPALFGLPLLGIWVWAATRKGLSPLDGVASQIQRRAPQQLQPVIPTSAPREVRPMLEALNDLFRRVEDTLEAEKRFTADAAHELRTPLAALQAQLQVALRARSDDERESSLANLRSGLARATHLVDQMLQLARLDPESGLPDAKAVDLSKLAEDVCAELGTDILAKELDFALEAKRAVMVLGQEEWLRILLRNLVDNAIRYTPAGERVRVTVDDREGRPSLAVTDSGPGIPAEQREAALRRFHRLGDNQPPGSGLGLSIAARVAELHGARLELADAPYRTGLNVSVAWKSASDGK